MYFFSFWLETAIKQSLDGGATCSLCTCVAQPQRECRRKGDDPPAPLETAQVGTPVANNSQFSNKNAVKVVDLPKPDLQCKARSVKHL